MTGPPLHRAEYRGFDGAPIMVHIMGEGPAVLLLHGLFSNAHTNWIRFGTAARIAAAGFRLLMPDLRGHGQSARPGDAAAWPADVLARDIEAILPALGIVEDEMVLGGYSLGARTVVRLLARGMRPRAAILAGMGLDGILDPDARSAWFMRMIDGRGRWPAGSHELYAQRFMESHGCAPEAMRHLLDTMVATPRAMLATLDTPTLVVSGADDQDNGSAADLAAALPAATHAAIPGNHASAVTGPALGDEIARWLEGHAR